MHLTGINTIKIIAACLLFCSTVNTSTAQFSATRILRANYRHYFMPNPYRINMRLGDDIPPNSPTIRVLKMLYPYVPNFILFETAKSIEYDLTRAYQMYDSAYIASADKVEAYLAITNRTLPSFHTLSETQSFKKAYSELTNMLEDSIPVDLKRAIFLAENAFNFGQLDYESYRTKITEMVRLCKLKIAQKKLDMNDNMVKNMMIFHFLSDTFKVRDPVTEQIITHYPLRYDTEDFLGEKDLNSAFVTKLVASGVGQCRSMPLLYLILAEELDAEAYLSYAPHHSFVKIKGHNNSWYNVELTCGYLLSDYHYMNSSFIKAEAVRNKLYLHPMEKKEIVANMMFDLARFYIINFGYDEFVKQCYEKSMPYAPNSKMPIWLKLGYEQYFADFVINMHHYKSLEEFKEKEPELYDKLVVQKLYKTNEEMDRYGFEETPKEIYEQWVKRIREKKNEYQLDDQINLRKTVQ